MFEGTLDVIPDIEGTLAGSGIAFFADISAGLLVFLVLVQPFGGADGKIAVFKGNLLD